MRLVRIKLLYFCSSLVYEVRGSNLFKRQYTILQNWLLWKKYFCRCFSKLQYSFNQFIFWKWSHFICYLFKTRSDRARNIESQSYFIVHIQSFKSQKHYQLNHCWASDKSCHPLFNFWIRKLRPFLPYVFVVMWYAKSQNLWKMVKENPYPVVCICSIFSLPPQTEITEPIIIDTKW